MGALIKKTQKKGNISVFILGLVVRAQMYKDVIAEEYEVSVVSWGLLFGFV